MLPTLLNLGPIPVHGYGLMIGIGFVVSLYFIGRDAQKAGYDPKVFTDCAFYVLPIGIAGTRLAHIIMFPEAYSWSDPIGWIAVWEGGLVFQGGPPPAILFVYVYLKRHGVNFWKACDVAFPYLALAHGFGRVGCFLNGCCYGRPSDAPWAFPFRRVPWDVNQTPTGSPVFLEHMRMFSDVTHTSHWSHAVHPTQLYSALGLWAICLTMILLRKHWHPFIGFTMPVYFVVYSVFRFIVEFFRGDGNPVHLWGLTDQQIFCVFFAVFGVILFFILKRFQQGKDPISVPA